MVMAQGVQYDLRKVRDSSYTRWGMRLNHHVGVVVTVLMLIASVVFLCLAFLAQANIYRTASAFPGILALAVSLFAVTLMCFLLFRVTGRGPDFATVNSDSVAFRYLDGRVQRISWIDGARPIVLRVDVTPHTDGEPERFYRVERYMPSWPWISPLLFDDIAHRLQAHGWEKENLPYRVPKGWPYVIRVRYAPPKAGARNQSGRM
ncbi:MAG: hypothetical protein ACREBZ_07245 [Thermoplasmata archaeon]